MIIRSGFQKPVRYALAVLAMFAAKDACGQDAKASPVKPKFVRSLDPATPLDLFMLWETSASVEVVEVTGCNVGKVLLARTKMIETDEKHCPNGTIPGPWSYVILGTVYSVQADQVTISYDTTSATGAKKTLTVPKTFVSNTAEVKKGTSVIFYHADLKAGTKQENVVRDFKAFEQMVKVNPSNVMKEAQFKVQAQW